MKKAELRKLTLKQRKSLTSAEVNTFTQRLLLQFSKLDFSKVKIIHIFLPINEKNEPDTFLFIDWLKINYPEIKIIVPKADFETAVMNNYVYLGRDDLQKNIYNILEPQKAELHTGDVDMVIIPMLAFDSRGYRVGYGKGFYDRFLLDLVTIKVGISFFESVDNIDDVNGYDVRLDLCLTPEKVYYFDVSENPLPDRQ